MQTRRMILRTYGGQKLCTDVCTVRTRAELQATLGAAANKGLRVTFRSSGHAFDTQSLNEQLVIDVAELEGFQAVGPVNRAQFSVTVGAAASWGEILAATTAAGLVPYAMPSSSTISAGGSLSAHTFSRFSAHFGREGQHIESFDLMTLDGQLHTCTREVNSELYFSAIGGLGYVGLVLSITYRLYDPIIPPGHRLAVKSEFLPITGIQDLASKLVECVNGHGVMAHDPSHAPAASKLHVPYALTACLYMNKRRQGVLTRSHYAPITDPELEPAIEHQPHTFLHQLLQLAAIFPWTRRLGWWLAVTFRFNKPRKSVDEPQGYSFFEDGNRIARRFLGWFGLSAPLRQQTYMIPWDSKQPEQSAKRLQGFLDEADQLLDREKLLPAIIDIGHIAEAEDDKFYLSSSHRFPCFAVSFAFQRPRGNMLREEAALRAISVMCQTRGGRVHLVKNAYVDRAFLPDMCPALEAMIAVKKRHDANAMLANEFLDDLFPELAKPATAGTTTPPLPPLGPSSAHTSPARLPPHS